MKDAHPYVQRALYMLLFLGFLAAALCVSMYVEAPEEFPILHRVPRPVTFLFVGDMMFDRTVRQTATEKGFDFIFACSQARLKTYDAVIGNLEGPITDKESVSLGSEIAAADNFNFTFPTDTAAALKRNNIQIVDLGNNHILNQGTAGLHATRTYLDAAGVGYFGGIRRDSSIYRTIIKEQNFSFISFNEFGGESTTTTMALIQTEKAAGQTIIIFAHWGDEYLPPPERVKVWAQAFAEAGADIIVGAHPHVVSRRDDITTQDGRVVRAYYSLGNFIFDQFWNADVSHGAAVGVSIVGGVPSYTEYATTFFRDRHVCIADDDQLPH